MKNGGSIINSDLTAYIPVLSNPFDIFKYSARKATNKAISKNVFVKKSDDVESFYNILLDNRRQLNILPTHTYEDIEYLKSNLPEKVFIFIATVDNIDIAGTLVFKCNNNVLLDFYWAHLEQYQSYRPINVIVHEVTRWAFQENIKFFDFGTQTLNMIPNIGGTKFKESLGSNGIFRHSYKLVL